MLSTVKIEYRSYVPSDWIAIPFTDVEIFNNPSLEHEWKEIKSKIHNDLYGKLDHAEQSYKSEMEKFELWRKESFFNLFKSYPFQGVLDEKQSEFFRLKDKIVDSSAFENRWEAHALLKKHGYVLTQSSESGSACSVTKEIFSLNF